MTRWSSISVANSPEAKSISQIPHPADTRLPSGSWTSSSPPSVSIVRTCSAGNWEESTAAAAVTDSAACSSRGHSCAGAVSANSESVTELYSISRHTRPEPGSLLQHSHTQNAATATELQAKTSFQQSQSSTASQLQRTRHVGIIPQQQPSRAPPLPPEQQLLLPLLAFVHLLHH